MKKEPILARQLEARFNAAKSCLARVARWCFKGRRHEAEAFEILGGGSRPPAQQEKAGLFFYSEGVRSKIGISGEEKSQFFLFVRKKNMGRARASRPVPGLVPLKYFPPLEAATAADLA